MSIQSEIILNTFQQLFFEWSGELFSSMSPIKPGASLRKIFRLKSDNYSCIGIYNDNAKENTAFIDFTYFFNRENINVPEIYSESEDRKFYLEEDLGDENLYSFSLKNNPKEYYYKSLDRLSDIQVLLSDKIDYSLCYETNIFNEEQLFKDLNKFEKYFANQFEVNVPDFNKIIFSLSDILKTSDTDFFMFRDFQPRNIMLHKNDLYFIDYQSGRKGLLEYDTASFIFSGSSFINQNEIKEYFEFYTAKLTDKYNINYDFNFDKFLNVGLMRIFQMLGSYGYSYYTRKNESYILKIKKQIKNLEYIASELNNSLISECVNRIKLGSFISRINTENNSD
ncbi:MAG TPA: hypothetical protein PLG90_06225 [Ignavibacteria bacterium]|nr:hypothetical protein [Ignavibacteria bacterium]